MDISGMLTSSAMPDIALFSVNSTSNKTQETVGTAMLAKSLDAFEANGAAMRSMLEQSVNPNIGGNIDYSV